VSLSGPFLFDPRAFWGDENVKMMNGEQVAAYLRLLSHQWEEGSVPAEPRKLAVIVNDGARAHTPEQFEREVWPALSGCFERHANDGERLVNPRLASERESWLKKQRASRKQARIAGIASGKSRRRKAKPSNDCSTDVERTLNENEREANGKRTISCSSSCSLSGEGSSPSEAAAAEVGEARAGGVPAAAAESEEMAYFHAIEETFLRLRGSGCLLAPPDYQAARGWHTAGVPLDLVLAEIAGVFERRRERGDRGPVNSLRYCASAVESAWAELRELQAPGDRAIPPPAPPRDTYRPANGAERERWGAAVEVLRAEVDPEEWETFIRPLAAVEAEGEHDLALVAPSEPFAYTVEVTYLERIAAAVGGTVRIVAGRAEAAA
jgi:hypothetical protein